VINEQAGHSTTEQFLLGDMLKRMKMPKSAVDKIEDEARLLIHDSIRAYR
jgi:hypothetical protein